MTLLIGGILLFAFGFAVYNIIKNKKKGGCSACNGCSNPNSCK